MASKFACLYPTKDQFISDEDLRETEHLLKNLKCSRSKTATVCQEWVERRKKSIENIDRLEKQFSNVHQACSVAHGVGAAMEIVGGVAMVAGAILTACGQKSVGEFLTKKVSPVTLGTGLATSVSSSVIDAGCTFLTVKEVQTMLKKDEELSQELTENLLHSRKIDSNCRRIFNCSFLSDIFLSVVQLCTECIPLLEVGYVEFTKLKFELARRALKFTGLSDNSETVIDNVYTTMKKVSNDPKARQALKNICGIIQQSPSTVEFIKFGLRVSIQVCDVLKVDIFAILMGLPMLATSAATKCLFGTVIVAVNVLSIISAAQDAEEGGSSKYSKMLKELKMALVVELNTVRENYSCLL